MALRLLTSPRSSWRSNPSNSFKKVPKYEIITEDVEAFPRRRREFLDSMEHQAPRRLSVEDKDEAKKKEFENLVKIDIDNALTAAKDTATGRLLLKLAEEHVQPSWLGNIEVLSGNIYRIAAFDRHHNHHMYPWSTEEMQALADKKPKEEWSKLMFAKCWTAYFGFLTIWIVQIVGPPAICLSTAFAWGIEKKNRFKWEVFINHEGIHPDFDDWSHIALTKSLGMCLICCFCLNATFTLLSEVTEWQKVDDIFQYVQRGTSKTLPGEKFLFIGGLTNCWVVFWCCINSYVVIGGSLDPKSCIMDSLGLIFMFNLDDIGGDLAFVTDSQWPGAELGWVYHKMVAEKREAPKEAKNAEEAKNGCSNACSKAMNRIIIFTFQFLAFLTSLMAFGFPILSAMTPWRAIIPE